jgi:hypothetical protein
MSGALRPGGTRSVGRGAGRVAARPQTNGTRRGLREPDLEAWALDAIAELEPADRVGDRDRPDPLWPAPP